jgi:hypothetical protein
MSNDIIKSYNDVRRRNRNQRDGTFAEVNQPATQSMFRTTFAKAIASGVDPDFFAQIGPLGTGITYSQTGGNLVINTGTTANSELILRSNDVFSGPNVLRWQCLHSQRIANTNFVVELVDVLGDNCAVTVNSAVSITVNIPGSPFTSANVGQSVSIGAISGAAGVPGRYVIASVSGPLVTLTVAGWPASGTATCTVYGWNFHRSAYTGATATALDYDAGRKGYASGNTVATIATSLSPGHMGIMTVEDGMASLLDQLIASGTAVATTQRASRVVNIPDELANLYLQIRCTNGTVAPASTTAWTIGMASVSEYSSVNVAVNTVRPQPANSVMPVSIGNVPAVTVSSGTITTVTTVTTVGTVTAANLNFNQQITDVASAALTTTTTTATITPTFGISYQVNIPVTAVSGTPTLDVTIEESDDGGTNWFRVYDFPRITAVGNYRSPIIPLIGNRIRYVQTVGGGTPSVTRSINRLQSSYPALMHRQLVDRTITLTTLNSVTPTLIARDAGNATQLIINVGAITTTAPAIQLEGSDDFGATWYAIGSPLTAVASSTVQTSVLDINAAALRARVSTAGVGVTAGYVMIKAHD